MAGRAFIASVRLALLLFVACGIRGAMADSSVPATVRSVDLSTLDQQLPSFEALNERGRDWLASSTQPRGPLRAVLIACGSVGDVLPLVAFSKQINAFDWVKVVTVSAWRPTKTQEQVEAYEMNFCPLMDDLLRDDVYKSFMKDFASISLKVMLQRAVTSDAMALQFALSDSLSLSINEVVKGHDVVLLWHAIPSCSLFTSRAFWSRIMGIGSRPLVIVAPTSFTAPVVMAARGYFPRLGLFDRAARHLAGAKKATNSLLIGKITDYVNRGFFDNPPPWRPMTESVDPEAAEGKSSSQAAIPTIIGWSKVFVPDDYPLPAGEFAGGTWQRPPQKSTDENLLAFLDQHPRDQLVYVGMGSLADASKEWNEKICRLIEWSYKQGWFFIWQVGRELSARVPAGLSHGDSCLGLAFILTGDVSHTWLLPQVHVAIHHGGSGTTQAALLAGCASIIVPQAAYSDQPYFSNMVNALHVGIGLSRHVDLTGLRSSLRTAMTDETIQQRVLEKQRFMQNEVESRHGARVLAQYLLLLRLDMPQPETALAATQQTLCLQYGDRFHLRLPSGAYCRIKKHLIISDSIMCDTANPAEAAVFFLEHILQNLQGHAMGSGAHALLGYERSTNGVRYIIPSWFSWRGYVAAWSASPFRSSNCVDIYPGRKAHCIPRTGHVYLTFHQNLLRWTSIRFSVDRNGALEASPKWQLFTVESVTAESESTV